ncbi:MAG: hypothetical protein JNK08_00140 [Sediminibacterium sp.]|nr:hypothetical protein [Sediminibacterium sp.]
MNKSHVELLAEIFKEFHKDLKEQGTKLSEFFDKIIVWLIGLSTGAIALIFSSLEKLNFVTKQTINWTLIFLVISILCGILGRVLYAVASYIAYSFSALFDLQLKMLEFPHNPRKISETETSEMIYQYMLEDFKIDMPSILEHKNIVSQENWKFVDENARLFYQEYSEWSQKSIQFAIKDINRITTETFGHPDDFFEKRKEGNNRLKGRILRSFTFLSFMFYITAALSFGLAIANLTFRYIQATK